MSPKAPQQPDPSPNPAKNSNRNPGSSSPSSVNGADGPPPEYWQLLLAGYVLGDLSSEEGSEVQQYLAAHPEAERAVAKLQATLNLLPLSLPEAALPPAGLQAQLLRVAAKTPQQLCPQEEAQTGAEEVAMELPGQSPPRSPLPLPSSPQTQQRPKPPQRFPWAWAALAAATAIALLGWQNIRLHNDLQFAQQNLQLAQQRLERLAAIEAQLASAQGDLVQYQALIALLRLPENRLLTLSGTPSFSETSSGSIVIAPRKNWAILTIKDLPKPPPGKAYQLWAMAGGQKVYCVEFKPDAAGEVLVEIPVVGSWATTPTVSITLEDEGTIPTQTSEMVMNGMVI